MVTLVAFIVLSLVVGYLGYLLRRTRGLVQRIVSMEMGSLHWESEVLARLYKEDHPEIEWNRDEHGYITGIMHTVEVNMKAVGEMRSG
jgi:hypothetical protein